MMSNIKKLACSMTYEQNIIKLSEEVGELLQAVSDAYMAESPYTRQNVIEEMADVIICMEVIRYLLRIDDAQLVDMKYHKMMRNLQRIGECGNEQS